MGRFDVAVCSVWGVLARGLWHRPNRSHRPDPLSRDGCRPRPCHQWCQQYVLFCEGVSSSFTDESLADVDINSDNGTLLQAQCASCEVTADMSAYWAPLLYFRHGNGSFQDVPCAGMTVYYLCRWIPILP